MVSTIFSRRSRFLWCFLLQLRHADVGAGAGLLVLVLTPDRTSARQASPVFKVCRYARNTYIGSDERFEGYK